MFQTKRRVTQTYVIRSSLVHKMVERNDRAILRDRWWPQMAEGEGDKPSTFFVM